MRSKITRRVYRTLRQADLMSFAENVLNRTKTNPAYAALGPEVQTLETYLRDYTQLLAKARMGSPEDTLAKEYAKKKLREHLDVVASALESNAANDALFIVNAGFTPRAQSQRFTGPVEPPRNLRASGTGRRGEIRIGLEDPMPGIVRTHALEFSLDQGASWQNGTYHSKSNFVVTNLPHSPELWIRVCALATRGRKSEWSEPVMVAVP